MTRLAQIKKNALALPAKQRIKLVQDIWDSIAEESGAVEVPQDHLRLIKQREADHERNPQAEMTWPEAKRRIQRKLDRQRSTKKSA